MANTILPNGESLGLTPNEIYRFMGPNTLRQVMRQERLRWLLKVNRDVDYIDKLTLSKHSGEIHNEGAYQKMEIRTFPDNGANPGYAGIYNDTGVIGIAHDLDKWDKAISSESLINKVNRSMIGAYATITGKEGHGVDENGKMSESTDRRTAAIIFDPFDGRGYYLSNDEAEYINNDTREDKLPGRSLARICDIPTRMTQLSNDLNFITDPDYHHTDNNFTHSNRYVLDNLDDRTFVYPEISKDSDGNYVKNIRVGLNGEPNYQESDGAAVFNSHPDISADPTVPRSGDRKGDAINSYGKYVNFSGVTHDDGYLPGIFRSYEELCSVDLLHQTMTPLIHDATPGAKRQVSYYVMDGVWTPNWFDRTLYPDSWLAQPLNPYNMEITLESREPAPYRTKDLGFDRSQLYQWRYNRINVSYSAKNIVIDIDNPGENYQVNDVLRYIFGEDVILFIVTKVGANGTIQEGTVRTEKNAIFDQDPSTHGIGVPFTNHSSVGRNATFIIDCQPTITANSTQIKNNLYAYVDITPSVRSDNSSSWSDTSFPETQDGKVAPRSTAAGPAYSGVNSGRGGPTPNKGDSTTTYHEHGGNPTAGVHVHLFRYVINTENPTWEIVDGVQVFTGKWVDQGPMGVERPCDIKALLLSNPDTNNFNNYYKFMLDAMIDNHNRTPDAVVANNTNATSIARIHFDQVDPDSELKFIEDQFDPITSRYKQVDITDKVLYINIPAKRIFVYNASYKYHTDLGSTMCAPGWVRIM